MVKLLSRNSNEVRILQALENKPKSRRELLEELDLSSATFQYTIGKLDGFIFISKDKKSKAKKRFIYNLNHAGEILCKSINLAYSK